MGAEDTVSFGDMKADPERVGMDSLLKKIDKFSFMRLQHLGIETFASFNGEVLQRYRQRVNSETAREVKQHPDTIRYGLCAIFLYWRQWEIIDGLIELFIQIVHRLSVGAECTLVKCDEVIKYATALNLKQGPADRGHIAPLYPKHRAASP